MLTVRRLAALALPGPCPRGPLPLWRQPLATAPRGLRPFTNVTTSLLGPPLAASAAVAAPPRMPVSAVAPSRVPSRKPGKQAANQPRLVARPPVVTIMGHVDHGKTTLLDRLRGTSVAASEAGGITQSIGAFQVDARGTLITWIDTPGHEAFSSMRHTGAHSTDVVVLVVAADAGVQPQTEEAVRLIRALGLPTVVAVNKVDKERGTLGAICKELTRLGLHLEKDGGDVQVVPISALSGEGLPELVAAVVLSSELLELRVPENVPTEAMVLESRQDPSLGNIVTAIAYQGAGFQVGQFVVADHTYGRIRAIRNEKRELVQQSKLSQPVEIAGLATPMPEPGSTMRVVPSKHAAELAIKELLEREQRLKTLTQYQALAKLEQEEADQPDEPLPEFTHTVRRNGKTMHVTADGTMYFMHPRKKRMVPLNSKWTGGWRVELPQDEQAAKTETTVTVLLKAESTGALSALQHLFARLANHKKVHLNIIGASVGEVSENEVYLSGLSNAHIVRFSTKPLPATTKYKQVLSSAIIYELYENVAALMIHKMPDVETRKKVGSVTCLATFPATIKINEKKTKYNVFGGSVTNGKAAHGHLAEVVRNGEVVHEGRIISLRFHKEEMKEITAGSECGLVVDGAFVPQPGDVLHCCQVTFHRPTIESEFGKPPPITYSPEDAPSD